MQAYLNPQGVIMSNTPKPQSTPQPITVVGEATEVTSEETVEKRPNVLVRGYRKARTNPKQTLAVIGGAVLVGGAAFLGRATANTHVTIETDPQPINDYDELVERLEADGVLDQSSNG